jgi:chaperone required for assembly of F1-ATPase
MMVHMSNAKTKKKPLPKRFYERAVCEPMDGGFVITLDGKKVRTPQQKLLHCASQQLAQQIVAEWNAQVGVIDTDTMPLTRLLNIALDRVPADRAALLTDIAGYAETDLLCYHAPEPQDAAIIDTAAQELAALQMQHFTPILQWLDARYGMRFQVTQGVMPVAQPAEAIQTLAELFSAADDHTLAALSMMVPLLGSALLALAIWKGGIAVEVALVAARLDEAVQEKHWGADPQLARQWNAKCRDVRAAAFFLTAI